MAMTVAEMIEANEKRKVLKREDYKSRAACRPELGSWHTITERAVKVRDGEEMRWESEPIEDVDARCTELVFNPDHADHPRWAYLGSEYISKQKPPVTSYRAMYIGYRFKFNGEWKTTGAFAHDIEDTYKRYFSWSETVEVWMFVTHDNRNPVAVFPFEIKEEEQE